QSLLRSGNSTLYQKQVILSIHANHFQILDCDSHAAHVSGHSLALEHLAGRGAGAVGTLMTMELGTVSHRSSVLTKSLDRALESLTFGDRGCVNLVASRKDVCLDLVC